VAKFREGILPRGSPDVAIPALPSSREGRNATKRGRSGREVPGLELLADGRILTSLRTFAPAATFHEALSQR
jgi:hypothetical protein